MFHYVPGYERVIRMAAEMEKRRAQDPVRYKLCSALAHVSMCSFDYWWGRPEDDLQDARVYYLEDREA